MISRRSIRAVKQALFLEKEKDDLRGKIKPCGREEDKFLVFGLWLYIE